MQYFHTDMSGYTTADKISHNPNDDPYRKKLDTSLTGMGDVGDIAIGYAVGGVEGALFMSMMSDD